MNLNPSLVYRKCTIKVSVFAFLNTRSFSCYADRSSVTTKYLGTNTLDTALAFLHTQYDVIGNDILKRGPGLPKTIPVDRILFPKTTKY